MWNAIRTRGFQNPYKPDKTDSSGVWNTKFNYEVSHKLHYPSYESWYPIRTRWCQKHKNLIKMALIWVWNTLLNNKVSHETYFSPTEPWNRFRARRCVIPQKDEKQLFGNWKV